MGPLRLVLGRSAVGLGEDTEAPGEGVIVTARARSETLIEVAHAAANAHGLVDLATDHLAVRDIVCPPATRETDVVLAGEGVCLCSSESSPRPAETGRLPRAEVATIAANALDDEQVFTSDFVDIGSLEKIVLGCRKSNDCVPKAIGEVRYASRRAVEMAIVVGREEVAV